MYMQALLFLEKSALDAASDIDVGDIPDGQLVIVAPTNEAFSKALEALDASLEDVASNTELLSSTLAVHIGVASNLDSDTATTLSPTEQLTFMGGGEEVILKELAGDVLAGTGSVMGPVNSAIVIDVVRCPDNKQIVLVADAVLPTALASAPTNAPEPVVPEPATPEPSLPASASKSSSIGMVTIMSLIAARFL
ncbi:hypothetical protein M9435_000716 [Picochlorum sp. BPE23]|nr:hypothetical protein M9435_000716 [Picochlorum sp. BPE23]